MEKQEILNILDLVKKEDELPYIEIKNSLSDKNKIGETLSALSNSASYYNKDYGYMIWGLENKTWKIVGTSFNIEAAKQGKSGFIYPQILKAFNYSPYINVGEFEIEDKKIFVIRIRNCGNQPLTFNKVAFIRVGEYNDELFKYSNILKSILHKNIDWSNNSQYTDLDQLDNDAYEYLRRLYFKLEKNKHKDTRMNKIQFLNSLSLLDSNNKPNNTCLVFLGDHKKLSKNLRESRKITYKYFDEKNNKTVRISSEIEGKPFILLYPFILDEIEKRNFTLEELDLFRNDIKQYDMKAVEEFLINAIVHRDWNIDFWIEILHTPETLEIRNPGIFRSDLDEVLRTNNRKPYINQNMAIFLKDIDLMEQEGGGIKRSMSSQFVKGLDVKYLFPKDKVYVKLYGKVKDQSFARFLLNQKESLSEDQIIILSKIYDGRNLLGKDILYDEFMLVKDFVKKIGSKSLKIKDFLLKKNKQYLDNFVSSYSEKNTAISGILDFAKNTDSFTNDEVYSLIKRPKSTVRKMLMQMVNDGILIRVKNGTYKAVPIEQSKIKKGL